MAAERFRQSEANVWELPAEPVAGCCKVFHDMLAGGEEVGKEDHFGRTALNAERRSVFDGRLGEFEVGWLDVLIAAASTKLLGDPFEIGIGLRPAAAVSDQQKRDVRCGHRTPDWNRQSGCFDRRRLVNQLT